MPESRSHMRLVSAITKWIELESTYTARMAILISDAEGSPGRTPPNIYGFIPDVFGRDSIAHFAFIGEAKTPDDIETLRSRNQFSAYLNYLAEQDSGHLIIAVPWFCVLQMRSLIRLLQRKTGSEKVKITILEQLPG